MTDIAEILTKEVDALVGENMDRLEKSIAHIQLKHDPEHLTRYVCDEKDGVYSNGRFEPYKNHMRNCRSYEINLIIYGKISD